MDLRAVNKAQFREAKNFWAWATTAKLAVFIVGLYGALAATPPAFLPQLILGIAVASELLQLRSDGLKARAESLLRKLDLCKSFGQEISATDIRDIAFTVPKRTRNRFHDTSGPDSYFASTETPGPTRAAHNLYESAWYNARQAAVMAAVYGVLITVFLITSVVVLIVAMRQREHLNLGEPVIRIVTAWLMLVVSLNMLKTAWGYFRMYQRSSSIEGVASRLSKTEVSEADALRQWHEYQVARNSAPLMPDWLWKLMEDSLNDAWARANTSSPSRS